MEDLKVIFAKIRFSVGITLIIMIGMTEIIKFFKDK